MATCLIILLIILFIGFALGKTEEVAEGVFGSILAILFFLVGLVMTALPIVVAVIILAWLFS
jgi:Na+/H+-dicarboxylate symporter